MGLAASHARLCMLTMRKADCEGRLVHIANKKMRLAHDSQKISAEYERRLNSTILTVNTGNKDVPMTYGLIMSSQWMLTNSTGSTVLSGDICDKVGFKGDSGKPTYSDKAAADFITAMGVPTDENQVATTIKGSTPPPGSGSGSGTAKFTTSYNDGQVFSYISRNNLNLIDAQTGKEVKYSEGAVCFSHNNDNESKVDWNQKVTDNVTGETVNKGIPKVSDDFNNFVGGICKDSSAAVKDVLKQNFTSEEWSSISKTIDNAALVATEATKRFCHDLLLPGRVQNMATDANESLNNKAKDLVQGSITVINDPKGKDEFYIDPNQIVKVFLNYFDAACQSSAQFGDKSLTQNEIEKYGENLKWKAYPQLTDSVKKGYNYDDSWVPTSDQDASVTTRSIKRTQMGTDSTNSVAGIASTSGASSTNTQSAQALYYYHMFENICDKGWVRDNDVADNKDYLQGRIQYGDYSVQRYQNGAWVDLSTSSPDSPLNITDNTEVQKKAEAWYDAEKDKIKAKEAKLDVEQTNADTERQAVVTDMDSVKKLIDKNMDMFKLYEKG